MTRKSLGYAYVNFHHAADAERALDTMNFTDINGKPCRIMWSQRDPSLRKTGLGNIFVRNLAPTVDNKILYDTFSVFGNILSCKVVTDETGKSKGYGYVHFETADAAMDAIQKINGILIDDFEVQVMHFVRKADRPAKDVWTNLYVKQFPSSWDEQKLREIFGAYGEIVSLTVSTDADGKSKGFGFVNYNNHEAAARAQSDLNNKEFQESADASFTLYVNRAQKKAERVAQLRSRQESVNQERVAKFQGMNLYVKNISDTLTDEQFRDAFAAFGNITSARIMRENNEAKTSKGFGFVCFSTVEEASNALNAMNSKPLAGKPLYVAFYQKKEVRRAQFAANFAPNMRFGAVAPGVPMQFMGMYMPQGQPVYPGQMQPRGMPYNQPYQQMQNQQAGRGMPNMPPRPMNAAPQFQNRAGPGFYPQVPPYMQQAGGPQMAQNPNFKPRGPGGPAQGFPTLQPNSMPQPYGQNQPMARPRGPMPGQQPVPGQMPPNMSMQGGPRGPAGPVNMGPGQVRPLYPQQGGPMPVPVNMSMQFPGQQPQQRGPGPQGPGPQAQGLKFSAQARNQSLPGMMPQQNLPLPQVLPQKMEFPEALLATADPQAQKNMIGEKLYPLIFQRQPEQAGKITGMLLEMDNGELLNLIESPEALQGKIEEALQVLRNHKVN
jgi:polyadenylate-binding protein